MLTWSLPLGCRVNLLCQHPQCPYEFNSFGRQFHWDIVHGKNEYLYSFVSLFIMQNVCPCLI